jgi:hypothetical protein
LSSPGLRGLTGSDGNSAVLPLSNPAALADQQLELAALKNGYEEESRVAMVTTHADTRIGKRGLLHELLTASIWLSVVVFRPVDAVAGRTGPRELL